MLRLYTNIKKGTYKDSSALKLVTCFFSMV